MSRVLDDAAVFRVASKLAAKVGLRWHNDWWPNFDRSKGHAAEDASVLCHEIGHHLVSPKWLRNRAYFGLGHPSDAGHNALVHWKYAQALECEASILGIVLERECGQRIDLARATADDHNWLGDLSDDWLPVVERLNAKGLWSPTRELAWFQILRPEESAP